MVKKCRYCNDFFPAKLKSFIDYCSRCFPFNKERFTNKIKRNRMITIDNFNVYDTDYPRNNSSYPYERVCRICGSRLLKKDGTYSANRRHCKLHTNTYLNGEFTWQYVRDNFIVDFYNSHEAEICLRVLDSNYRIFNIWAYCFDCGKLLTKYDIEVHHIIPVHTLSFENIKLIWDINNLVILCRSCHPKRNHYFSKAKLPKEDNKNQILMDLYIGGKKE